MTHEEVLKVVERTQGRIGVLESVLGETTKTLEELAVWSSRVEMVHKSVEGSLAALRADIATLEERLEALETEPFVPEVGMTVKAIDTRGGEEGKRTNVRVLRFMNSGKLAVVEDADGASFVVEREGLSRCS